MSTVHAEVSKSKSSGWVIVAGASGSWTRVSADWWYWCQHPFASIEQTTDDMIDRDRAFALDEVGVGWGINGVQMVGERGPRQLVDRSCTITLA